MIKIVTTYSVVCDRCGKTFVANGGFVLVVGMIQVVRNYINMVINRLRA